MVKIALQFKASLSNVNKLYPHQPEQFCWPLKVKCTSCDEESKNWHLISQDEVVDLKVGQAHFLYKCKNCNRENSLSILPSNHVNQDKSLHNKKYLDTVYEINDDDKFKTIISFDCRGLVITAFEPRDGWAVVSNNKIFVDVDLSENDWCEYNDVDNVPVAINNIHYKFITLK